jgi:hypothetical protein
VRQGIGWKSQIITDSINPSSIEFLRRDDLRQTPDKAMQTRQAGFAFVEQFVSTNGVFGKRL